MSAFSVEPKKGYSFKDSNGNEARSIIFEAKKFCLHSFWIKDQSGPSQRNVLALMAKACCRVDVYSADGNLVVSLSDGDEIAWHGRSVFADCLHGHLEEISPALPLLIRDENIDGLNTLLSNHRDSPDQLTRNNEWNDYVVTSVIRDLRAGEELSDSYVRSLVRYPLIDAFVSKVMASDESMILQLLSSSRSGMRRLGIWLSRGLTEDVEITLRLRDLFETVSDFSVRNSLMHELSRRSTDDGHRKQLIAFIRENYENFIEKEIDYFGGGAKLVQGCSERLNDNRFRNKKWVYLLSLTGVSAEDVPRARAVIQQYTFDPDEFTRSVAEECLRMIGQDIKP